MASPTNPLVLVAATSALVGIVLATVVWRQRDARGARPYTVLMLLLVAWSGLYVFQLLGETPAAKRPWLVTRHAISPAIPVVFWIFAARYTDSDHLLAPRYLYPIVAIGVVLAPLPIVDPGGLYWSGSHLTWHGSLSLLDLSLGPLFWIMVSYIALVVATGHVLFVTLSFASFAVYRRQLIALAVVGVVEFALLAVFLSDHVVQVPSVNPVPNLQVIAFSTVFMAIPLGWSYYRDALFSLQPLAHRTVIGNMDDAVFVLDTDGVVRKANGPARVLLDVEGEHTLEERRVADAFVERPALLGRYRTLVADGTVDGPDAVAATGSDPVPIEVDGERRFVDVRVSAIDNAADEPIGSVLVVRDVTERARQRDRLERKNEQLERLADVVSHDMRGPLATAEKIRTLIERDLAAAGDQDAGRTLATADVERSLEDLAAVHDRLREFADHLPKLARESTDVESPVDCDLAELATDAWRVVDAGPVALQVESTTTLRGDPRRLRQALENLFRNAIEHGNPPAPTSDGGARRGGRDDERASTNSVGRDGGRASGVGVGVTEIRVGCCQDGFYVADDGPGIPPDRREDVFEYGVSTDGGSGFGLTIVRTIVEAHGWEVGVTESEDGGARFDVRTER